MPSPASTSAAVNGDGTTTPGRLFTPYSLDDALPSIGSSSKSPATLNSANAPAPDYFSQSRSFGPRGDIPIISSAPKPFQSAAVLHRVHQQQQQQQQQFHRQVEPTQVVKRESSVKGKQKEVIDLTEDDDIKIDSDDHKPVVIVDDDDDDDDDVVEEKPKSTYVCIGQLSCNALVLYPPKEFAQQHAQPPQQPGQQSLTLLPVQMYRGAHASKDGKHSVRLVTMRTREDFGFVEHRYAEILGPLLGEGVFGHGVNSTATRGARLWLRASVVKPASESLTLMPLWLLLFARRQDVPRISKYLDDHTLYLQHPHHYIPGQHDNIPYENPHNPATIDNATAERLRRQHLVGLLGGNYTASKQQSNHDVQRQQVDDMFNNMKSGTDLEETEPPPIVSTKLYPHQKQAVSFILDRERLVDTTNTVREGEPIDIESEDTKADKEGEVVSLWERMRDGRQRPRGWKSIVTGVELTGEAAPPQARGSILADDMGLGKTLVVIAVIAITLDSGRAWADTPVEHERHDERIDKIDGASTSKPQVADFGSNLYGLDARASTSAAVNAPTSKKQAAKDRREQKRSEALERRFDRLVCKSRATLIVCPLSTVQNWESQVDEHVCAPDGRKLSVYVYHGSTRQSDPRLLADHDVVLTTYSTVGAEYSRQLKADDAKATQVPSDDDFEIVDTSKPASDESAAPKKRKRKPAKTGLGATDSTLQQIQWFRVVLDEAHIIKEHSTIQARAACELSASRRLALSGTPLQNSLQDLFSLVRFLRLEPFTDRGIWNQYIGSLVKANLPLGVSRLKLIMRYLALRRTKDSKDKDGLPILSLPPNTQSNVYLTFDAAEHAFYSSRHARYKHDFKKLQDADTVMSNYCSILQEILRLRQICVHTALVRDAEDANALGGDLSETIWKHGISKPRALQLVSLVREAGGAQCAECQYEFAPATSGLEQDDVDADEKKPTKKRSRKLPSSKQTSRQGSEDEAPGTPKEVTTVVTRCQHLFCFCCFRARVTEHWPQVDPEERAMCTVCKTDFTPALDAVTLTMEEIAGYAGDGGEDCAVHATSRLHEHSTKTRCVQSKMYLSCEADSLCITEL